MTLESKIGFKSEDLLSIWTFWRRLAHNFGTHTFEISGVIDNKNRIILKHIPTQDEIEGAVTRPVPPETDECLLAWHLHPPTSCLEPPEEDTFFRPPSGPDIFYVLLAAAREIYDTCAVISIEGVYTYKVNLHSPFFIQLQNELREVGYNDYPDERGLPVKPIMNDDGGYEGCEGGECLPSMLHAILCNTFASSMFRYNTHEDAWSDYQRFYHSVIGNLVEFHFVPKERLCNYSDPDQLTIKQCLGSAQHMKGRGEMASIRDGDLEKPDLAWSGDYKTLREPDRFIPGSVWPTLILRKGTRLWRVEKKGLFHHGKQREVLVSREPGNPG